ncbi:MAG: helix-turn-helix domain-containing protein [Porticoccaceae bacterium]
MTGKSKQSPLYFFGRRLAHLRKVRSISQEELALISGLARSYVSGVERGQRNISLVNICRLAEALHVPPSSLLEFSEES